MRFATRTTNGDKALGMHIALTITELDPGGAETCLVHLACYLAARGHEVAVFCLGKPPSETRRKLTDRLDASNISWNCGGKTRAFQFPAAVQWLRRELRRFSPDVVQSMLYHANVTTALALSGTSIRLYGGVRVRQPQRTRWWLQRFASSRMSKLVCVSDDVARHCIDRERILPDKVVVIPNGIDLSSVQKLITQPEAESGWQAFGLPSQCRVLLYVGRLDAQKGVVELLPQADELLCQAPEHHFVLMGDGPQREQVATGIAAMRSAERVHLVGWQTDPICWMAQSELVLLPAQYEGMPNVILEAMAVGKPVVSYRVDGLKQLLGDGAAAELQLVPPGNHHAFAHAIHRLILAPDIRDQCGRHNHLRATEHFQLFDQMKKYETLYGVEADKPLDAA
ncbi:MAG: glycosyltransferase [Planctomycetales bacterium]|nr:glycosyltransferase [Planctomycetales bacterium]